MPDGPEPFEAVSALAGELTKLVELSRTLVDAGRTVDLAGLDGQVGLLCAKSLDLPPDQGRRIRPRLIALSGSIEALSRALQKAVPWSSASPRS
jgi:hypothetical protein